MGPTQFMLLTVLVSSAVGENLDITTIYRHHLPAILSANGSGDTSTVSEEFHMRTNALGILLKEVNGTFKEPERSSHQLHCTQGTSTCSWSQIGIWTSTNHDMEDVLPRLQVKFGGNACDINNGGCQVKCQISNASPACSCPIGFNLNSDQKTCRSSSSKYHLMTTTSERITSPNHPSSYHNGAFVSWLLVAPELHRIKLTFTHFETESGYDFVTVYDGSDSSPPSLGRFSGSSIPNALSSKHNKMVVTFSSDSSNSRTGFAANFVADRQQAATFSLKSASGSLRSTSLLLTEPKVCVSIIYKLASTKSDIRVTANPSGKASVNLTRTALTEVNGWNIGRFKDELTPQDIVRPISVSVHMTEPGSSIFSIMGCNPNDDEDVYTSINSIPQDKIPKAHTSLELLTESTRKCYNGGVKVVNTNDCLCPAGFMGPMCEEGCGPNRYGEDCKGICSGFQRGCRLMIFCKLNLPCLCAPGFGGSTCDSQCNSGYYGASCRTPCGRCSDGDCDIYTGECINGCRPGFYPPLCQDSYQKLAAVPIVLSKHTNAVIISANLSSTTGYGVVRFYQIQYKEKDSDVWQKLQPQEATSGVIQANLEGLKSGAKYQARVILINSDGNSYQEENVPTVEMETPCTVPTSKEYHLTSENITTSSFDISWKYDINVSTWCAVTGFEVTLHDRWEQFKHNQGSDKTSVTFPNLLSGQTYGIQVQARISHGKIPISPITSITTADKAPGRVIGLLIQSGGVGELRASWNKPRILGGTIRRYRVEYQCLKLLACSHSCESSAGQVEVSTQSVVLTGLLPHAQYVVKVAGLSGELGPYRAVLATTDHTAATTAPAASRMPINECLNTSFVAHWEEPVNCTGLNGYLQAYRYELVTYSDDEDHIERTGSTTETHANFTDLLPHTQYKLFVYLVTSGGWSTSHKLVILATTSATSPEHVQDLKVYKRGRRLLGIRWAPPIKVYGSIKSFNVSYHKEDEDPSTGISELIKPELCSAWPGLYCHTITGLIPETHYIVTVRARNAEVERDGFPISIKGFTHEIAPAPATSLQILNRTHDSLIMEWGTPDMINGVLRSFLVNVEETDSFNVSNCCTYFPIQELPVRREELFYRLEVGGLNPASTYTISVSAKTVTMGPTINITTYTPPVTPEIVLPPEVLPRASVNDVLSVALRSVEATPGLKSTYLLMILPPEDTPEPLIWDPELAEMLKSLVIQSFYIVGEFEKEDLIGDEEEVNLGTGSALRNGTLGQIMDPVLTPGTYRAGLALVLDYYGAKSVGFAACEPFTVS